MLEEAGSQELAGLVEQIIRLGALVEDALRQALRVLQSRDEAQAQQIIAGDKDIDQLRNDLEEQATHMLAFYQALAERDARLLIAVFSIVRHLERIGDGAAGIAQNTLQLRFEEGKERSFSPHPLDATGYVSETSVVEGLLQLGLEALRILQATLKAFASLDAASARFLSEEDDVVDVRYHMVRHDLMKALGGSTALTAIQQDSKMLQRMTHFLWMAHKLERISDHCINICERIIYIQEGNADMAVSE